MEFVAPVITGSGRGKGMGIPTFNLDLSAIPAELQEGIYACKVTINEEVFNAALHYGPRPVHKDIRSCEVHILDPFPPQPQPQPQPILTVHIIAYLRPVLDFPTEAALIEQINDDITKAHGILRGYDASFETADS